MLKNAMLNLFQRRPTSLLNGIFLGAAAVLALTICGDGLAQTPSYPSKPIRLLVGFAPGGAADYVARVISGPLSKELGQTVIVENRAGAGSSIAADIVAKSPPDGYTILLASPSSISVNAVLNPKLPYSAKDFAPVTKVTSSPLVVAVNPKLGIESIEQLIKKARANPGALNFASSGNGSAPHLAAALFMQQAQVQMTHVPYKGGSLAIQSVIAGDTDVTFGTPPSVLAMSKSGRLKAIGVTSQERTSLVPGVPGMRESGLKEYSLDFWYGVFVPTGTSPEIIQKLFASVRAVLAQPGVQDSLAREGTEVASSTSPQAFSTFLSTDNIFWTKLVTQSGAKID